MEKYGKYVKEKGKDPTGLVRWSWIKILKNNEITTTVVSTYLPCRARKTSMLSKYAQQKKYWLLKGVDTCQRKKSGEDLIEFITLKKGKEIE